MPRSSALYSNVTPRELNPRPTVYEGPPEIAETAVPQEVPSGERSKSNEMARAEAPHAQTMGNAGGVEGFLAAALERASAAGRWDVVAALARELEARRLANETNVVRLNANRGKEGGPR